MYPLFPPDPASIVELGCFRDGRVLIFNRLRVGFSGRLAAGTSGSGVAVLGIDDCFLKGWDNEIDSITKHTGIAGKCVLDAGMHGRREDGRAEWQRRRFWCGWRRRGTAFTRR